MTRHLAIFLFLASCAGKVPSAPDAGADVKRGFVSIAVEAFCAEVDACRPGAFQACYDANMLQICNVTDCDAQLDHEHAQDLLETCVRDLAGLGCSVSTSLACSKLLNL